jgi:membrane-associated phospholipid phosphatase
LGVQAARHRDHSSINAFVTIPFSEREFVPKVYEPAYYQAKSLRRPSIEDWRQDTRHAAALIDALGEQSYKNVRVQLKGRKLYLSLSNSRISNMGRAVGRAARTALLLAPEGINGLHITYTTLEQPIATYEFFELEKLSDYLAGQIPRSEFLKSVLVRYANQGDLLAEEENSVAEGVREGAGLALAVGRDGDIVQLSSEDREANRVKIIPKLGFYFNDPSGALRYEIAAQAIYNKRLGTGFYLNGVASLSLLENVSGVTQPSNSLLPHVRTDVAEYKRGNRLKVQRLLVNKYFMPEERWYVRLSGGIYEEMFRGVGGQVMYLPKDSRWAADLSVDTLQQRDYNGWFGKLNYRTTTALAAVHYRLPQDITATVRVGSFLAKDTGARMELKRRFRSGIEVGAWYARTNGNDVTSPGTVAAPYHDRGIFLSIPLGSMLPSDSQATAGFAISPWTRDVGQMVVSPGDLYGMVENPRRDMTSFDGLGNFSERADEQNLPAVNPPPETYQVPWEAFRHRLQQSASATPAVPDVAQGIGLAAGSVFLASRLDRRIDRFVSNHEGSAALHRLDQIGKAAPIAALGLAGAALAFGDNEMGNTGAVALQSAFIAAGASVAMKYMVGRARPSDELGPFASAPHRSDASFPSNHTALVYGALTPFAQQYDAPWLYGVGVLTGMGRMAGRNHWFSDNVASGLIGYTLGTWLWDAQRDPTKGRLAIQTGPRAASVTWNQPF